MTWLTSALKGIGRQIVTLCTSSDARKRAEAAIARAGELAVQLYPVVERVAAMTPNRTDDEIISCINTFGLMGLVDPHATDKTDTLHNIALTVAGRYFPGANGSLLSLAIETAYQAFKANAQPKAA